MNDHQDHRSQSEARRGADDVADLLSQYRSEWEKATSGGPEPSLAEFLFQVDASSRALVRDELEKIDQHYQNRSSASTDQETEQTHRYHTTMPSAKPGADRQRGGSTGDTTAPVQPTVDIEAADADSGATKDWDAHQPWDVDTAKLRSSLSGLTDYEVMGELGRGGMGVVYKAREKSVNRIVALKMLLGGGLASRDALRRFQVEVEAVASLDHPNIIPVYHVGEHEGMPYFAMKYVDGAALSSHSGEPFSNPRAAARLIRKICLAVDYAHKRGILHRDLKPGNILIDPEGEPHITDFGLAKRLGEDHGATQTGTVMGTPDYMAPEQAKGDIHKVSVASDVYSLGSILYDLLTGEPPFRSETVMETLIRVTKEPVRAPSVLNRAIDPDMETICLKCLEKEPEQRYSSAQEVADELGRYLAGEPIAARRIGKLERTRRWCKRNPVVASLVGVVLLLVAAWLVGLNVALLQISGERDIAQQARDRAQTNEALALETLNDVIGKFHDGLRDRTDPRELRRAFLGIVEDKFEQRDNRSLSATETANLVRRTKAALHQRIADMLLEAGRVDEALLNYLTMAKLVQQMHDDAPDRPENKKFMAACSNKLADTYLHMGQPHLALDRYQRGLAYRKDWVELLKQQPDRDEWEKEVMNAQWDVSVSHLLVCGVHLMMGDPDAAREYLTESNPWAAAVPEDPDFESATDYLEMARRFELHGHVSLVQNGFDTARTHYQKSIRLLEKGLKHKEITKLRLQQQLASCNVSLGNAYLQYADDADKSLDHFSRAADICLGLYKQDAQNTETLHILGRALYGQGIAAGRQNDDVGSQKFFQQCLQHAQKLANMAPNDVQMQIHLMMALARCAKHEQAVQIAERVRQEVSEPVGAYRAACCYAVCAADVARNPKDGRLAQAISDEPKKVQNEYVSLAVESLTEALKGGWQDLRTLETNPDLNSIDLPAVLETLHSPLTPVRASVTKST